MIHRELKRLNLKVKINTNVKQVQLDVPLDLVNDIFQTDMKYNATLHL